MCISTLAKSGMFGLAGLAASHGNSNAGGSSPGFGALAGGGAGASAMILPRPQNNNRLAKRGTPLPTGGALMAMGGK